MEAIVQEGEERNPDVRTRVDQDGRHNVPPRSRGECREEHDSTPRERSDKDTDHQHDDSTATRVGSAAVESTELHEQTEHRYGADQVKRLDGIDVDFHEFPPSCVCPDAPCVIIAILA